jgi:hypothetical protein
MATSPLGFGKKSAAQNWIDPRYAPPAGWRPGQATQGAAGLQPTRYLTQSGLTPTTAQGMPWTTSQAQLAPGGTGTDVYNTDLGPGGQPGPFGPTQLQAGTNVLMGNVLNPPQIDVTQIPRIGLPPGGPLQVDLGQLPRIPPPEGGPVTVDFSQIPQITPPAGPVPVPAITPGEVQPGAIPQIIPPEVAAAQGGFADFQALQNAVYGTLYDPVAQALAAREESESAELRANLARAGLSTSGVARGAEIKQANEFTRQYATAAQNAANQAAAQRYGLEYQQSLDNAKLRQESNLANAGFSLQAQQQNAGNTLQALLQNAQARTATGTTAAQLAVQSGLAYQQLVQQGRMAEAANYLDALGMDINSRTTYQQLVQQGRIAEATNFLQGLSLNMQGGLAYQQLAQQGQIANVENWLNATGLNLRQGLEWTDRFLNLTGLYQQDLARMDSYDVKTWEILLNTYLQTMATLTQAGGQEQTRTERTGGQY